MLSAHSDSMMSRHVVSHRRVVSHGHLLSYMMSHGHVVSYMVSQGGVVSYMVSHGHVVSYMVSHGGVVSYMMSHRHLVSYMVSRNLLSYMVSYLNRHLMVSRHSYVISSMVRSVASMDSVRMRNNLLLDNDRMSRSHNGTAEVHV